MIVCRHFSDTLAHGSVEEVDLGTRAKVRKRRVEKIAGILRIFEREIKRERAIYLSEMIVFIAFLFSTAVS